MDSTEEVIRVTDESPYCLCGCWMVGETDAGRVAADVGVCATNAWRRALRLLVTL